MASPRINRGKYLYGIKRVLVNIRGIAVAPIALLGIKRVGFSRKPILLASFAHLAYYQFYTLIQHYITEAS